MAWTEDMNAIDKRGADPHCRHVRQGAVLFTTSDLAGGHIGELLRLLESIRLSAQSGIMPVRHYILLQRCTAGVPPCLSAAAEPSTRLLAIGGRVSLSRARNLLLRQARLDGALACSLWAGFPDDDAWYPPSLLPEIGALFAATPSLALVTCGYGANPAALAPGTGASAFRRPRSRAELVRTVSSNTLMLRASTVEDAGDFDERLGIGAPINGGEDLDYALRALACMNGQATLSDRVLVGHRDRLPWVRSRYFAGSLFALSRAARARPALLPQVLRKLLVGLWLTMLREMTPGDLARQVRAGLAGWTLPLPVSDAAAHDPSHFTTR